MKDCFCFRSNKQKKTKNVCGVNDNCSNDNKPIFI
jgi:hypothetical protein